MINVEQLIIKTHTAAIELRRATDEKVRAVLIVLADMLEQNTDAVLKANLKDLSGQESSNPRNDRLMLNEERIKNIAVSIRTISNLDNPCGKILEKRRLANGLLLEKRSVPLGVVGAVYESRPNVTFDIASLCIRSQNGCLLKGSSDAEQTNIAAVALIKKALKEKEINPDCITLLPSNRKSVEELFTATKYVDVLIPRGSDNLIQYVRKNSLVPVIETGAGVCHVYVEKEAALDKALSIVVNAKVSRPSVCNAVDAILIDEAIAPAFLEELQPAFKNHQVEVFAEPNAYELMKGYSYLRRAEAADFGREFLSMKCAIKVVKDIDEALAHIQQYSTKHSEAIVSENEEQCERFLQDVDAAAVYSNASTRFTDGEEFGLGAEIGISTQKLHARGPFALEKLVTEKWIIKGDGQIR